MWDFLSGNGDIHAVDFHAFFGTDEDVLHTSKDPGLDQIPLVGGNLDFYIRCDHMELFRIHQIAGMDIGVFAEKSPLVSKL